MSHSPHGPVTGARAEQSFSRRPRLAVEVAVVLAVKFAALLAIWSVWFDDRQDYRVDGEQIARTIYAAPAASDSGTGHAAGP
jgi:hypothetical protein